MTLIIFDEAKDVPPEVWEAVESWRRLNEWMYRRPELMNMLEGALDHHAKGNSEYSEQFTCDKATGTTTDC